MKTAYFIFSLFFSLICLAGEPQYYDVSEANENLLFQDNGYIIQLPGSDRQKDLPEWAKNFSNYYSDFELLNPGKKRSFKKSLHPYHVKIDEQVPNYQELSCTQMMEEIYKLQTGFALGEERDLTAEEKLRLGLSYTLVAGTCFINPAICAGGFVMLSKLGSEMGLKYPKATANAYTIASAAYLNDKASNTLIQDLADKLSNEIQQPVEIDDLKQLLIRENESGDLCMSRKKTEEGLFYFFFPYDDWFVRYIINKGDYKLL